jgi:hypothetical protein
VHEDVPDTVYPELHVGWHVDLLSRVVVQLPTAPFVGAATPAHLESKIHIFPPCIWLAAASFVPSLEEVMLHQDSIDPAECSVQVVPESLEVQIFPCCTTAASCVPSLDDAMLTQRFLLVIEVISSQVVPELLEVQIFPIPEKCSVAAR